MIDSNIKFKPTAQWMRTWYDIINQQLFNGQLGDCILKPFTTGRGASGKTLGVFKITAANVYIQRSDRRMFTSNYPRQYVTKDNFVDLCKPEIGLNANYSASQNSWIATLAHEMCHYYTYMYGYAPKQGHGRDFKEIGALISERSNGMFTIQRLATAEEMEDMVLDAEIEIKNKERQRRKNSRTIAVINVLSDGSAVRLSKITSENLLNDIINLHESMHNTDFLGTSNDINLIEFLNSKNYIKVQRTYRFWNLIEKPWLKELLKYNWKWHVGNYDTLQEALIENNILQENTMANINKNSLFEDIVSEILSDFTNEENNDDVRILPDMNLGLASPLENI